MRYRLLGQSGLRVSELCLGTMTFGDARNWGADRNESRAVFDAFVAEGGNFFDTAPGYQDGGSEEMLGEFIATDRHRHVIATKFSLSGNKGDPNSFGNGRKNIVRSVETSLKRMRTDYIDLLWMHAWDGLTPVEEVMHALDDLVESGKLLYCGFSDTPAWVIAQAATTAQLRGWAPLVAVQLRYSLVDRSAERELLPMAAAYGLSVLGWGSVGGGLLSGKYAIRDGKTEGAGRLSGDGYIGVSYDARTEAVVEALRTLAKSTLYSPSQIALAWVRGQCPGLIPLIGARTLEQYRDNVGCLNVAIDPAACAALDDLSAIDMGFPMAFLQSSMMTGLLFGDTYDRLDATPAFLR